MDVNGGLKTSFFANGSLVCENTIQAYGGGNQTTKLCLSHFKLDYLLIATTENKLIEYMYTNCTFRRAFSFPSAIMAIEDMIGFSNYVISLDNNNNLTVISVCPNGQKSTSSGCQNCNTATPGPDCDACYGNNRNADNCSCFTNYYSVYQFSNPSTYDCLPCRSKCIGCDPVNGDCLACIGNFRATPLCGCDSGYYDPFVAGNSTTYDCVRCTNSKCSNCSTGPATCTACFGSNRNSTDCNCQVGYYDPFVFGNSATYNCVACMNAKCFDCKLVDENTCDNCKG